MSADEDRILDAAPAAPRLVNVINPEGKLVSIAHADVPAATADGGGYRVATPQDELEAKYSKGTYETAREKGLSPLAAGATTLLAGPGGQAAAWREGGFSGATADLGPLAVSSLAGLIDPRAGQAIVKTHRELAQAYPNTTAAGEVGGQIAAMAVGGASPGGLARALPANMIGELGAGVEGVVGRGLAGLAERGALGRAASTGAQWGVRGAVETAAFNATHEFSEQMMGDHEANGEKIFAAASEGVRDGMLFGGGLGAAGSFTRSGVRGLSGLLADHAGSLRGLGDEQAWKALDPLKKYSKEAEARFPGGVKGVGRVLMEEGVIKAEDGLLTAARTGTAEELLPRITEAKDRVGSALGDIHATTPATSTWGVLEDHFAGILKPLDKKAGQEGVHATVSSYAASLREKLGVTADVERMLGEGMSVREAEAAARAKPVPVQDLIFQRKALDELVYQESKALDPKLRVGLLRDFRTKFENTIVDSIGEAAEKAGVPETREELLTLKRKYQALSLAEDAATDSSSRMQTNRNLSLSDYMGGGMSGHIGSMLGSVAGPVGSAVGGAVGSAVGAVAHRVVRQRGNATAAAALYKLSDFAQMQRAILDTDKAISAAAKGIVGGTTQPVTVRSVYRGDVPKGEPLAVRYRAAVDEVAHMQATAAELLERVSRDPIPHAPRTSEALAATLVRTAAFLSAQIPHVKPTQTIGSDHKNLPPDYEMATYLRKFDAAKNPKGNALAAAARGDLSREQAIALQVVSPKMFAQLQKEAVILVASKQAAGTPISFDARQRLHLTLGVVTDPSQDPSVMKMLQGNLASAPDSAQNSPGPAPSRPVALDTQPSKLDRLETR